jgi:Protein of unknown function (DUF3667)
MGVLVSRALGMTSPSGDPSPARAASAGPCLNCGAPRFGEYCHACGQRFHDGRLTLGVVWRWFAHDVLDFDGGLLRALREMTVRPGAMIRRYIAGERQRYGNPFTYLFLAVALSLIVWTVFGDLMAEQMKTETIKSAAKISSFSPAQKARWIDVQLGLVPYTAQIALAMCLMFVAMLRLFFRKSGFNFAEIFVFGLFSTGQIYLCYSVLVLALLPFRLSYWPRTGLQLSLYPIIYTHAALGFFGRRFGTAVKVLLALMMSFVTYALLQSFLLRAWVRFTT